MTSHLPPSKELNPLLPSLSTRPQFPLPPPPTHPSTTILPLQPSPSLPTNRGPQPYDHPFHPSSIRVLKSLTSPRRTPLSCHRSATYSHASFRASPPSPLDQPHARPGGRLRNTYIIPLHLQRSSSSPSPSSLEKRRGTQPATTCCALYALVLVRSRTTCFLVLSVLPLLLQGVALSNRPYLLALNVPPPYSIGSVLRDLISLQDLYMEDP